jgi:hypothetical protein
MGKWLLYHLKISYSLRLEISFGNFILTGNKVCTKSPTFISDQREYMHRILSVTKPYQYIDDIIQIYMIIYKGIYWGITLIQII